jgi:hypothetical protein
MCLKLDALFLRMVADANAKCAAARYNDGKVASDMRHGRAELLCC